MRTPHDCTIYRKSIVDHAEVWTSQQIAGVMWENRKAANVLASGNLDADQATVYIPFASIETLNANKGDVLVKGLVSDAITSSFTIGDLMQKYDDVVTIRSIDTMDYGSASLHHWQIGAS